jgi:hypothetical protein
MSVSLLNNGWEEDLLLGVQFFGAKRKGFGMPMYLNYLLPQTFMHRNPLWSQDTGGDGDGCLIEVPI